MTVDLTAVDAANTALQKSNGAAPATKQYAAAVTAALHAMNPPAPTPPAPPTGTAWAWDATTAAVNPAVSVAALVQNCAPGVTFSASVAVATADASSPGYAITSSSPYSRFDPLVYIPAGAQPNDTPDYDGHLTILDPVHGRESDMEQAKKSPGGWSCDEGNSFALGSVTCPAMGAVTAACTPLARGIITPDDIRTGNLHTLVFSMNVAAISSTPIVYPGNAAGQPGSGPAGGIPFGGWVRLRPGTPIPPTLTAIEVYICHCLLAHGMILRDGGSNVDVYGLDAVNQGGKVAAWAAVGVNFDGYALELSSAIPWASLEALQPPAA